MNSTDRFFKYAYYKKLNMSRLERECGFSKGYLGKQKVQGSDMGIRKIAAIKAYCPDLNLEWLVTGLGDMQIRNENDINAMILKLKESLEERGRIIQLQFEVLEAKDTEIAKLRKMVDDLKSKV